MVHNREVEPQGEMRAIASFGDDPTKVEVILPPGDPQAMLADVATKSGFQVFGAAVSYSYLEKEMRERQALPANTLIEMAVPYCFHLPLNSMFELREYNTSSYLVFRKVWTNRSEGSSDADYYSPTHILYHNKGELRTPNFPPDPGLGVEPICEGINVEADSDRGGTYRYSLVTLFADTTYQRETLQSREGAQTARSEMVARGVAAINRFIDVYRVVTNASHIQRLPSVHVRDIFFRDHNIGFHGASFGHGIRTAIMNRSGEELGAISRMAARGAEIAPWTLLFLDAEASLLNNSFTLSVVNAFQALELRLDDFLDKAMIAQGFSSQQIEEELGKIWRTKERLKDLVPSLVGRRLIDDDRPLWDRFCWAYDEIRNKLIHAARDLDHLRTDKALTACRDVSRWLDVI